MSLNLCFIDLEGNYVEFPFQTPSELSLFVIASNNTEERIHIIKEYLDKKWNLEDYYKNHILEKTRQMLNNQNLKLELS